MPKFKSVLIKKEKRDTSGQIVEFGETVMVPLDDAAILEPEVEAAIEAKAWKKEDGAPYTKEEWEAKKIEVTASFEKKRAEFMRRRKQY